METQLEALQERGGGRGLGKAFVGRGALLQFSEARLLEELHTPT